MNKTQESNKQTVIETQKLLLDIINNPATFMYDQPINLALKSQGALAKFKSINRNISSCSLNTLKSLSDKLLDKGFLELDSLRVTAKQSINKSLNKRIKKTCKLTLQKKLVTLEGHLVVAHQSNFLLTIIIQELRSELKDMAEQDLDSEERNRRYKYTNKKVEAQLTYTLNGR